jgi:osmotically-inducible protein OsmY
VTAQDKTLLVNIRQKVQTEVRAIASSAGAWAPVNFKCDRGVVTIFGTVQSIEIKQQIDECVRRVPGVVRVEDTIVIAGNAGGAVGGGDSDQILVTRVRERVLPEIQIRGIDFQCHGGVVTVIGSVPQPEVKERLIALVRQVPGVVNVTDQITVNAEVQGQARTEESRQPREEKSQQTQAGRPEQTQQGLSERQRAVSAGIETSKTNLPPTGREGSLPPGLEKKEQLPPGLQNRDELPPGLSKRTNDSTRPNP